MNERDDYPETDEVELITEPCPRCGTVYTHPADEWDSCCSARCAEAFHAARQAEVNAALVEWWRREQNKMREIPCRVCRKPFLTLPETDGICSTECGLVEAEQYDGDDRSEIPF